MFIYDEKIDVYHLVSEVNIEPRERTEIEKQLVPMLKRKIAILEERNVGVSTPVKVTNKTIIDVKCVNGAKVSLRGQICGEKSKARADVAGTQRRRRGADICGTGSYDGHVDNRLRASVTMRR